jgi:two-component system NarL family response regulator
MRRLLLVDDHPLMRDGLRALLQGHGMEVVAEAGGVSEAIATYVATRPDAVVMDLQLGDASGLDAIAGIREHDSAACIIVLTSFSGDARARKALLAGARAYLLKDSVRTELVNAIQNALAGRRVVDTDVARDMASYTGAEQLSPRELEVLEQLAQGRANKEIGRLLDITEGTVKNHLKSILSKLGAEDRTHAVIIAFARGILEAPTH